MNLKQDTAVLKKYSQTLSIVTTIKNRYLGISPQLKTLVVDCAHDKSASQMNTSRSTMGSELQLYK